MLPQDFNKGWKFYKDGTDSIEVINLPHDAMIQEERSPKCPSGSAGAFFPGGTYRYEKEFQAPLEWKDKHVEFAFEGVYQNAKILLNGKEAGEYAYGYTEFNIDADGYLEYGKENKITVWADNSMQPGSRWYSGSGIYRPVWLYVGERKHILHGGVKISTLSYNPAKLKVETIHTGGEVKIEILYKGKKVTESYGDETEFMIPDAKLWSDISPELYECRVSLYADGKKTDEIVEKFGIRFLEWGRSGLKVNGKETLLRGGCVHHDNGILGAACYRESEERRVRIMKKAGYNAVRSAHNPMTRAMLDACDAYGMYVMDETWDMWYASKTEKDYSDKFEKNYLSDIRAMVKKDYNHPSVIMYSLGNEVTEPAEKKGYELLQEMAAYTRELDRSRAVSCGLNLWLLYKTSKGKGVYQSGEGEDTQDDKRSKQMNSTIFNMVASKVGTSINNGAKSKKADQVISPCLELLDIAGYNYSSGRYPLEGKEHPDRVIVGSETYPQDIYKNWEMVKKYPYLIGDFVWTSWDYLGEVGLGAWAYTKDGATFNKPYPWLLADCGTIDILGNIGAQADYAAVVWGVKKNPCIHVQPVNHSGEKVSKMVWRGTNAMPSWSWKGCEGRKAVVEVYSDAPVVRLMLNDREIGEKRVKQCKAVFKFRYMTGTLIAVACDETGKELGKTELVSAIGRSRIKLTPEKEAVEAGELLYINVDLVGENGQIKSNDDRKLNITVSGGKLLAFGSANPRTEETFNSGSYTTYYGRALAVVRSVEKSIMKITVTGENIAEQSVTIAVK